MRDPRREFPGCRGNAVAYAGPMPDRCRTDAGTRHCRGYPFRLRLLLRLRRAAAGGRIFSRPKKSNSVPRTYVRPRPMEDFPTERDARVSDEWAARSEHRCHAQDDEDALYRALTEVHVSMFSRARRRDLARCARSAGVSAADLRLVADAAAADESVRDPGAMLAKLLESPARIREAVLDAESAADARRKAPAAGEVNRPTGPRPTPSPVEAAIREADEFLTAIVHDRPRGERHVPRDDWTARVAKRYGVADADVVEVIRRAAERCGYPAEKAQAMLTERGFAAWVKARRAEAKAAKKAVPPPPPSATRPIDGANPDKRRAEYRTLLKSARERNNRLARLVSRYVDEDARG